MECWYIVVVLEWIQYEDTPPVDAPLTTASKSVPPGRAAHARAPHTRVRQGEEALVVVVVVVVFFFMKRELKVFGRFFLNFYYYFFACEIVESSSRRGETRTGARTVRSAPLLVW